MRGVAPTGARPAVRSTWAVLSGPCLRPAWCLQWGRVRPHRDRGQDSRGVSSKPNTPRLPWLRIWICSSSRFLPRRSSASTMASSTVFAVNSIPGFIPVFLPWRVRSASVHLVGQRNVRTLFFVLVSSHRRLHPRRRCPPLRHSGYRRPRLRCRCRQPARPRSSAVSGTNESSGRRGGLASAAKHLVEAWKCAPAGDAMRS